MRHEAPISDAVRRRAILVVAAVVTTVAIALATAASGRASTMPSTQPMRGSDASRFALAAPSSSSSVSPHAAEASPGVAAAAIGEVTITFSEFPVGTYISDQYEDKGILFSGDNPFITEDGANPTSPVLSGSPRFQGQIEGTFVVPGTTTPATVDSFTLDVGYIDSPSSVEVSFYDLSGVELGSTPASGIGINRLTVNRDGVHSFLVHSVGAEPAGFAIDNASFASAPRAYKYVALGDSFSSGEGIEPFFEPKNRCHRSKLAYPVFVDLPGVTGDSIYDLARSGVPGIQWGFQACSGATTDDVLTTRRWGDPLPQLALDRSLDTGNANDLPVDANTNLVTITIGGDDLHWTDVLKFCAFTLDCTAAKYKGLSLAQYLRNQRDALSPKLSTVYARIHAQAPLARILVLGYPQLFPALPEEQNCGKLRQVTYVVGGIRSIGFSQTEQNYLRQATSEANQLIAARAELAPMATFVPVDGIFTGHEVCGNAGEWINAVTLSVTSFGINDQSFHPNADGQRLGYAAAINNALNP